MKDEPARIREALDEAAARRGRDRRERRDGHRRARSTYEAVAGLLDKRLDGFGELFRMLSYAEIGSAAMLSRAVAGGGAGAPCSPSRAARGAPRLGEAHRAGGGPRRSRESARTRATLLTPGRRRPAKGREVLTAWKARAENRIVAAHPARR